MSDAITGLDGANHEAWVLYRKVVTRLAGDLHAGGLVLDRLTRDLDAEDFDDMWRRLGILYEALNPPPGNPKE